MAVKLLIGYQSNPGQMEPLVCMENPGEVLMDYNLPIANRQP